MRSPSAVAVGLFIFVGARTCNAGVCYEPDRSCIVAQNAEDCQGSFSRSSIPCEWIDGICALSMKASDCNVQCPSACFDQHQCEQNAKCHWTPVTGGGSSGGGDVMDKGDAASRMFIYVFFLFFFSIWNSACAGMLAPAWKKIFSGQVYAGFCQLALSCCIPHVAIGFWLPWAIIHPPICLIYYWPHFLVAIGMAMTRSTDGFTAPERPPSARNIVAEALTIARNPGPTLRRTYSSDAKFPERYQKAKASLAEDHSECSICFDALCTKPVGVLLMPGPGSSAPQDIGSERVCPHYFHLDCINALFQKGIKKCPLCRANCGAARKFPQIEKNQAATENEEWFYLASLGKENLEGTDLEKALKAVLPLSRSDIEAKAIGICGNGGSISFGDFKTRVPDMILSILSKPTPTPTTSMPPLLKTTSAVFVDRKKALFDVLDAGTNALSCAQAVRGFSKLPALIVLYEITKTQIESAVYHSYDWDLKADSLNCDDFSQKGGFFDKFCEELMLHPDEILGKPSNMQPLLSA